MSNKSLKLKIRIFCIILSLLVMVYIGFWLYRGRFIAVLLIFSPEEDMFNVNVKIPSTYKEIQPGEEMLVQISVQRIEKIRLVDIEIEYGIEDMEGNEITSELVTLAVEKKVSMVKDLMVPVDTTPGNYNIFAKMRYDDLVGSGKDSFKVLAKEELGFGKITVFSLMIVIFLLLISIAILSFYRR